MVDCQITLFHYTPTTTTKNQGLLLHNAVSMVCSLRLNCLLSSSELFLILCSQHFFPLSISHSYSLPILFPFSTYSLTFLAMSVGAICLCLPNGSLSFSFLPTCRWCHDNNHNLCLSCWNQLPSWQRTLSQETNARIGFLPKGTLLLGQRMFC